MPIDPLFSPFQLGSTHLANRVVMSPMTRSRSIGNVPGEIVATYYAQRAEAELIITEGPVAGRSRLPAHPRYLQRCAGRRLEACDGRSCSRLSYRVDAGCTGDCSGIGRPGISQ